MQKQCYKCKEMKELECFSLNKAKKDGYSTACKDCHKGYRRKFYLEHQDVEKSRVADQRRDLKRWFEDYKSGLVCEICGEDHPATLDFHHRDPKGKDFEISFAVKGCFSKERILVEVAKCNVWCSNCHRKYHWAQLKARSSSG